ncbi:hypothetical protein [Actinospica sp.]|jgi:hypothetical protein|uniref:hypothetical protein n=1 Tax=Actinospica sp. TaxID=1872142 RepID=UPI002B719D43|nr:hypothetical protein [Actinospica sp.]HWG26535.1 hypothetical protein [Actinospica sp.]
MRTTRLFGAAAVIGVLGGVGTGYAIQAARPATPLPPLTRTQPRYAPSGVYQGIAPAMLPAAQDDAALTDGDLTKLLLPVPAGAHADPSTWQDQSIDVEQDSDLCANAVSCFHDDFSQGVEAIADTSWDQNGYYMEVRIFRFAAGSSGTARQWAQDGNSNTGGFTIPSGINGSGYEFRDKYGDNDDTSWAVHGDLMVKFWVTSPTTVPNTSLIDNLMTQQMGRL